MDKISALGILICITLYGLMKNILWLININEKREFAIKFFKQLKDYINSGGRDHEAYSYLLNRSNKMQDEMGGQGIVHNYRPPYQNFMFTDYPIILNMIPELRKALEDDILSRNLGSQYAGALQEAMIRYIGTIEDAQEGQKSELKNPIIWLREGVRSITALPVNMLSWLGIISESTAYRINSSFLAKAASGVITVVGLVSSVFTIVLGWKPFVDLLKKFTS